MSYKSFSIDYRIYYEDTDAAGVVYHSNYLNFAERARTDAFRSCGMVLSDIYKEQGFSFVVYKADLKILKSAVLDDLVKLITKIEKIKGAALNFRQHIFCKSELICEINVDVVCLNVNKRPVRIPKYIINALT